MTTFADSVFTELDSFKSPAFPVENFGDWEFQDANEELIHFANYIKTHTSHNAEIEPERIKFLYTRKAKKSAGRFNIGELKMRANDEKMVNNDYDYIAHIYYPVWKDLDSKNKVIQLDKILCGIEIAPGKDPAEVVFKKKASDSREYTDNMRHFGADDVLKSSEMIDMAVSSAIEREKEEAKNAKEKKVKDANSLDEE